MEIPPPVPNHLRCSPRAGRAGVGRRDPSAGGSPRGSRVGCPSLASMWSSIMHADRVRVSPLRRTSSCTCSRARTRRSPAVDADHRGLASALGQTTPPYFMIHEPWSASLRMDSEGGARRQLMRSASICADPVRRLFLCVPDRFEVVLSDGRQVACESLLLPGLTHWSLGNHHRSAD